MYGRIGCTEVRLTKPDSISGLQNRPLFRRFVVWKSTCTPNKYFNCQSIPKWKFPAFARLLTLSAQYLFNVEHKFVWDRFMTEVNMFVSKHVWK